MATLLVFFVSGSITYLLVNSQKSAKGYLLQELQAEYDSLSSEKRSLDHEVMESESLRNLTNEDGLGGMVPWNLPDVTFLHDDTGLARNETSD